MVTIDTHKFHEDPKKTSSLCSVCKLPQEHEVHARKSVKGIAKPTKTG